VKPYRRFHCPACRVRYRVHVLVVQITPEPEPAMLIDCAACGAHVRKRISSRARRVLVFDRNRARQIPGEEQRQQDLEHLHMVVQSGAWRYAWAQVQTPADLGIDTQA